MTTKTIKAIIFIIFLVHGIGHYMGIISAWGFKLSRTSTHYSWLFTNLVGDKITQGICFILYALAFIGFIATALSFRDLFLPHSIWQTLALWSSVISALSLIFFWNALAMFFNKAGAVSVNFLTLLSILWLRWPSEIFND